MYLSPLYRFYRKRHRIDVGHFVTHKIAISVMVPNSDNHKTANLFRGKRTSTIQLFNASIRIGIGQSCKFQAIPWNLKLELEIIHLAKAFKLARGSCGSRVTYVRCSTPIVMNYCNLTRIEWFRQRAFTNAFPSAGPDLP